MPQNPPPVVVVQKKRGWGCWGCGCGVLFAIVVLIIALLFFMGRSVYAVARAYTAETPITIATADGGDAVLASAQQKIAAFQQATSHQQPATLHLSADEINTLIARDPAYAGARGHVHVDLKDDAASVQTSFLLGTFEKFMLADRYFNGTVTLGLGFNAATHQVSVDVHQLQMGDKTLPDSQTATLNQGFSQGINQKIQENPDARAFVNRATKIAIENGELVIETK